MLKQDKAARKVQCKSNRGVKLFTMHCSDSSKWYVWRVSTSFCGKSVASLPFSDSNI